MYNVYELCVCQFFFNKESYYYYYAHKPNHKNDNIKNVSPLTSKVKLTVSAAPAPAGGQGAWPPSEKLSTLGGRLQLIVVNKLTKHI